MWAKRRVGLGLVTLVHVGVNTLSTLCVSEEFRVKKHLTRRRMKSMMAITERAGRVYLRLSFKSSRLQEKLLSSDSGPYNQPLNQIRWLPLQFLVVMLIYLAVSILLFCIFFFSRSRNRKPTDCTG